MPPTHNAGIVALEQYFPRTYVAQTVLEKHDGVSSGKYVNGLEQEAMAFVGDREDIASIMMTAVSSLMRKYKVDPSQIGRIEVGTETLIDKSKAIKTTLMDLMGDNYNIEGVDNINACYGGTAALFNSLAWLQSPAWDGRYALVVCGDIAVYEPGNARPTGGAGATAMLLGPEAPIVIENVRGSHFENAYDFYKPNLESEYPVVDGALSIQCYFRAIDSAHATYAKRFGAAFRKPYDLHDTSFFLFHSPFGKLVRKSFARLYQNEWLAGRRTGLDESKFKPEWRSLSLADTYSHNDMQKAFCDATKALYEQKVVPSLTLPRQLGNTYTGSLYSSLVSLISSVEPKDLAGKRALLFSYGSGLASTLFSVRFDGSTAPMRAAIDLKARLAKRRAVSAEDYSATLLSRERTHSLADFEPQQPVSELWDGAYYLKGIDKLKRRSYAQKKH